MFGDFSSSKAQLLNVQFVMCHDRPDCKSEEEIAKLLRNRFFLLLTNQVRFDPTKYGQKAVIRDSVSHWLTISTQF